MELLEHQVIVFLCSVVVGAFLCAIYDIFRIARIAFKASDTLVFIQDIFYFVITLAISFVLVIEYNQGVLRGFLLIGELLGFVIYFFTVSRLIMCCANGVIDLVKFVTLPLYWLLIKTKCKMIDFEIIIKKF